MYNSSIIFFLHFHKAGGTTINNAFNILSKHNTNKNGNPWDRKQGTMIQFWNYDRVRFDQFLTYLHEKQVKFVCFEWNYFKLYNQLSFKGCEFITCFRDPYERYVSDMNFSQIYKYDKYKNLTLTKETDGKGRIIEINHNKSNYYVKMLNGFGDQPDKVINQKHLEIAKKNLKNFSIILILEDPKTFKMLERYGIQRIAKRKVNANKKPVDIPLKIFKKLNAYDYQLYEYAIKLSQIQMEKHEILMEKFNKVMEFQNQSLYPNDILGSLEEGELRDLKDPKIYEYQNSSQLEDLEFLSKNIPNFDSENESEVEN